MVPMCAWAKIRLAKLSQTDKIRDDSNVGSGFGKNVSNWVGRTKAYPTNALHLATECLNRKHSAVFPEQLPSWFINLFTQPGDIVLDPFAGSGTTLVAARKLHRKSIGIEINLNYCILAEARLNESKQYQRNITNSASDLGCTE